MAAVIPAVHGRHWDLAEISQVLGAEQFFWHGNLLYKRSVKTRSIYLNGCQPLSSARIAHASLL